MIERKSNGSVWNVAMLAVLLFLAAISFAGLFTKAETKAVATSSLAQ